MPPRGVKSSKRERQYEHIKSSAKKRGTSTKRAKEIAARTVNKQRQEAGETRSSGSRKASKTSRSTRSSASTGKGRKPSAGSQSRSTKRATKKR